MGRRSGEVGGRVGGARRALVLLSTLGLLSTLTVLVPAAVAPVEPAAADPVQTAASSLDAGGHHTCGVTSAGAVVCWGYNAFGQLGNGTTEQSIVPEAVSGMGTGVTAVAAGDYHSCALTSAGAVRCWGANSSGQLGDGSSTGRLVPVEVSGLGSGVTAIAAGGDHSCALTSAGAVRCWGANSSGQLGD